MKECVYCAPMSSNEWDYIKLGDPGGFNIELGVDRQFLCCWFYYGSIDLNAMQETGISYCPFCGRRLRDA